MISFFLEKVDMYTAAREVNKEISVLFARFSFLYGSGAYFSNSTYPNSDLDMKRLDVLLDLSTFLSFYNLKF